MTASWPVFPRELLASLRQAGPADAKLRFVLVDGGTVAVGRIVQEDGFGLLVETDDQTTLAIPWHALLRVEAQAPGAGRSVGFRSA